MNGGRNAAPVLSSVRWLLLSLLALETVYTLRNLGPSAVGTIPLGPLELLLFTLMPALTAFAFARLFLAVVQAAFGSLNTYTLTSSPWAWLFWLSFSVVVLGIGMHLTADVLVRLLPEVVQHGEFGDMVRFFDQSFTAWLLAIGLYLATGVILVLGPGAAQMVLGVERVIMMLASILTYGGLVMFIGVIRGQFLLALVGSIVLTAIGLRVLPRGEWTRDPVTLAIVPGTALAGAAMLVWAIVVGGQPTWPF
jgi:hypothetical protein